MGKKAFAFPEPQRMIGSSLVCPCCNHSITAGEEHVTRAEQEVHVSCSKKMDMVLAMKPNVEQVFEHVPADVLKEAKLKEALERAYTTGTIRNIVLALCEALKRAKASLKERFAVIAAKIMDPLIEIGARVQVDSAKIMKLLAV